MATTPFNREDLGCCRQTVQSGSPKIEDYTVVRLCAAPDVRSEVPLSSQVQRWRPRAGVLVVPRIFAAGIPRLPAAVYTSKSSTAQSHISIQLVASEIDPQILAKFGPF